MITLVSPSPVGLDLPPAPRLAAERPADRAQIEGLIQRAFGPGRYAKTAERLREGREPDLDVSVVAWSGARAIGCVRLWPILVGPAPALLLGPIAVEPEYRRLGVGAMLVRRSCQAADAAGHGVILLVGEADFFGPLGFSVALAADVRLPGPVDQRRVMARAVGQADRLAGSVRAPAVRI